MENMGKYIHVVLKGDLRTGSDVANYGEAYLKKVEETGIKRGLIDFRLARFKLNYYEMVQAAKRLEHLRLLHQMPKTAHLISEADGNAFAEYDTPTTNRGYHQTNFTDAREALAWLLDT